MNFTREPIIETIITPRDGYKLLVRNSKGGGQEDYYIDALEVVSFGHSFFFRSLERPKTFLVPVSDYEVIETKEVRAALKNVAHERSIKIGGGREGSLRREPVSEKEIATPTPEATEEVEAAVSTPSQQPEHRHNKRDRGRRNRGRGGRRIEEQQSSAPRGSKEWEAQKQQQFAAEMQKHEDSSSFAESTAIEGGASGDVKEVAAPAFTRLIPPPPTLISETISRYKDLVAPNRPVLPPVEPEQILQEKEDEDFPNRESTELHRQSTFVEQQNFTTQRSFLQDNNFFP